MIGVINTQGKTTKQIVTEAMDNIGLNKANLGYGHLRDAILECLKNPGYVNSITALYRLIAARNDSTSSRVERAIRHNFEILHGAEKRPTREYIAHIVDDINMLFDEEA